MIVCTGIPRSGTSIVMQTLNLLGVPMAAEPFLPEHENIKQFNPNGFYETKVNHGIKDERFKGKAVKLFGFDFHQTDNSLISKVIYVTRNRAEAIASYDKVRKFLPHCELTSAVVYDGNENYIKEKLKTVDYLEVSLEAIRQNPVTFVNSLIIYTGINPSDKEISAAINNIESCR